MKQRLDVVMAQRKLVASRSQAESYIQMGKVKVNATVRTKAGFLVDEKDTILLIAKEQYVSRAALKLQSADQSFALKWRDKTVLDVGSSTGGFTQYVLNHGAKKVIAVDVGTDQLHPSLRGNDRIELHEKTDIRNVWLRHTPLNSEANSTTKNEVKIDVGIDIAMCDVSFISLRDILPHVSGLLKDNAQIVAMVKPQFEAGHSNLKHKGVIKNDKMRREILKDFETWAQKNYKIVAKKDSEISGSKGNIERFYLLNLLRPIKRTS